MKLPIEHSLIETPAKFGKAKLDTYRTIHSNARELLAFFADKTPGKSIMKSKHNADRFDFYMSDERTQFSGGKFADISKPKTNFGPYVEYINSLRKLSVWQNIQTSFAERKTRRRVRCEYEGELDYDKRNDMQPFTRRGITAHTNKMVKLNIGMTFSARISSDIIDQYGAFIAAISNLLEDSGVGVELNVFSLSHNYAYESTPAIMPWIRVKRFDEYLSPQIILQIFNSNFYRRVIFGIDIAIADHYGNEILESLGSPIATGINWEMKNGEIFIYSCNALQEQEKCIESILKFIEKL